MEEIYKDMKVLWNYLCLDIKPQKSDCIIGLGSILTLIPKKCAELYKKGLGEYIIFSGNCGKGTEGVINITEAERFRNIAIEEGVPEDKIFIEPEATTTYENFEYINILLRNKNIKPNSYLIVGKPYQERRALAIADIKLPQNTYEIASLNITLDEYLEYVKNDKLMKTEDVINEMVGEVNLITKTPKFGLQSKQFVSEEVMNSYKRIIDSGYNKYNYSDEAIIKFIETMKKKRLEIFQLINYNLLK